MTKKKDKTEEILNLLQVPEKEEEALVPEVIENPGLRDLQVRQEQTAIEARYRDMRYIEQLDEFIDAVLDAMVKLREENPEFYKNMVEKAFKNGNMKQVKDLLVALGVAYDKREQLLSFDNTREKKGVGIAEFEFRFATPDGSQMGAKVSVGKGK